MSLDQEPSIELKDIMGIDEVRTVLLQRNRLQWFGHVQRIDEENWVNKCTKYPKLNGHTVRCRPKMTWSITVDADLERLVYARRLSVLGSI